ncbi:HD domain-containing phosphohydrolase [Oceanirhabdus sp. W0125-5]|uniref:HD domain-containing phosphohydrolase n=1 Tax=Oceanirhabdus sp. W0125-5 TaxID=2999116 RepID=UPI0022F32C09|nr:HD domain-containing phosphohydrolase [Oceanirhabdus sp. W0125-5]WBW96526.1 diguanylate cyclase [Oceanirhabdus sp. W0125-5]
MNYIGVIYSVIAIMLICIMVSLVNKECTSLKKIYLAMIACLFVWVSADTVNFFAYGTYIKLFLYNFKYLGILPLPNLLMILSMKYCSKNNIIKQEIIKITWIIPIISFVLLSTNSYHKLFFKSLYVAEVHNELSVVSVYGVAFWIFAAIAYGFLFISILILISCYFNLPKYYRGQTILIIIAMIPALVANIISIFELTYLNYDVTALGFIPCVIIYRYILFDAVVAEVIPKSREIIIDSLRNIIIITSKDGKIIDSNDMAKKVFGKYDINIKLEKFEKVFQELVIKSKAEVTKEIDRVEIKILVDGKEYYFVKNESAICEDGENLGKVIFLNDISYMKVAMKKLETMAKKDMLTGLFNRVYFDEQIYAIGKSNIEDKLPLAIVKGDINSMKMINDALGKKMGDKLIVKMSEIIKALVPENSLVARVGGDEFGIILFNTKEEIVLNMINGIKKRCEDEGEGLNNLSMCLGYSIMENVEKNIDKHVECADNFMYRKKMMESRSARSSVIDSLKVALEQSNYETKEHAERTRELAVKLAKRVGIKQNKINDIEMLALLHDIGKLAIPDSILMKPGKLTDEEFEVIKTHSQKGYDIAISSPNLINIAEGILHHHERWDGRGYPKGLKGEEIPIESRIITIVDSYDVMTNDRPYHKAMPKEKAIEELLRCKGSQFDPQLVDIMIEMVNE